MSESFIFLKKFFLDLRNLGYRELENRQIFAYSLLFMHYNIKKTSKPKQKNWKN